MLNLKLVTLVESTSRSYELLLKPYTSFSFDIFKKWCILRNLHVKNNYTVHCIVEFLLYALRWIRYTFVLKYEEIERAMHWREPYCPKQFDQEATKVQDESIPYTQWQQHGPCECQPCNGFITQHRLCCLKVLPEHRHSLMPLGRCCGLSYLICKRNFALWHGVILPLAFLLLASLMCSAIRLFALCSGSLLGHKSPVLSSYSLTFPFSNKFPHYNKFNCSF